MSASPPDVASVPVVGQSLPYRQASADSPDKTSVPVYVPQDGLFGRLPVEVCCRILELAGTHHVWRLRRLSKAYNRFLTSEDVLRMVVRLDDATTSLRRTALEPTAGSREILAAADVIAARRSGLPVASRLIQYPMERRFGSDWALEIIVHQHYALIRVARRRLLVLCLPTLALIGRFDGDFASFMVRGDTLYYVQRQHEGHGLRLHTYDLRTRAEIKALLLPASLSSWLVFGMVAHEDDVVHVYMSKRTWFGSSEANQVIIDLKTSTCTITALQILFQLAEAKLMQPVLQVAHIQRESDVTLWFCVMYGKVTMPPEGGRTSTDYESMLTVYEVSKDDVPTADSKASSWKVSVGANGCIRVRSTGYRGRWLVSFEAPYYQTSALDKRKPAVFSHGVYLASYNQSDANASFIRLPSMRSSLAVWKETAFSSSRLSVPDQHWHKLMAHTFEPTDPPLQRQLATMLLPNPIREVNDALVISTALACNDKHLLYVHCGDASVNLLISTFDATLTADMGWRQSVVPTSLRQAVYRLRSASASSSADERQHLHVDLELDM